jgi:hypothetical protein
VAPSDEGPPLTLPSPGGRGYRPLQASPNGARNERSERPVEERVAGHAPDEPRRGRRHRPVLVRRGRRLKWLKAKQPKYRELERGFYKPWGTCADAGPASANLSKLAPTRVPSLPRVLSTPRTGRGLSQGRTHPSRSSKSIPSPSYSLRLRRALKRLKVKHREYRAEGRGGTLRR